MDGYAEAPTGTVRVAMMPLGSHLARSQSGTQPVVPSSRVENYFYEYFGTAFDGATTAQVQTTPPDFVPANLSLNYRSFPLGGETSLTVMAPEGGQLTLEDGTKPDFLLFVDGLSFGADVKVGGGQYAGDVQDRMLLGGSLKYVLWDNQAQQVAAYGQVKRETSTTPSLPRRNYLKIFERLSKEMIGSMPLAPAKSIS